MTVTSTGKIFQINLSDGGVPKLAVREARVTTGGIIGDRQIHTKVHGGPERAVCIYPLENILGLQSEGHPIFPGAAGENLTVSGLDWAKVTPGSILRLGAEVRIEVTRYTVPCNALVPFFSDGIFNRIHQDKYPGWARVYAKVLQEGDIRVGDPITLE